MLESTNDILSLLTLFICIFYGIYALWITFDKHHAQKVQKQQEQYYSFMEGYSDEEDNDPSFFQS